MSKTIQEQIEVMQHYANGGEIECKSFGSEKFVITCCPSWNWDRVDYRIKEQKKTITIEKWLVFIEVEDEYKTIETSDIERYRNSLYKVIKLLDTYKVEL